MRIAIVSPYSWTLSGRSHEAHRGARRALHRRRPSRPRARAVRPRRPGLDACCTAAPRPSRVERARLPGLAGPHGRLQGQRRGLEPVDHALRRGDHAPGAAHRRLRRRPHPRAGRAGARAGSAVDCTRLPLVGTFHVYSESKLSNGIANVLGARRVLNRLHVRIAVSEAAAWTGAAVLRRPLRMIPNGVHVDPERAALARATADGRSRCGSCSSARPSSARACRCCCARSRRCASTSRPS